MRCAPGEARFRQRAQEASALGERELAGSAITSSRLAAGPVAPPDLTRALAEIGELAGRRGGDVRERVQSLAAVLAEQRARLELASAGLGQEERALSLQAEGLRHHAYLAQQLDHGVESALATLAEDRAQAVRLEILFPLRRRHQELLTQLAVGTQALAAVRLTLSNNRAVINSIQAATHAALTAAGARPG